MLRPSPICCGSVTERWSVPPPEPESSSGGGADAGGGAEGREVESGVSKSSALGSIILQISNDVLVKRFRSCCCCKK